MKTAATEPHFLRAATLVAVWLLSLLGVAFAPAQEGSAPPAPADRVLAHGTDRRVWAGVTGQERDGVRTWIQTREAGNPQWNNFARIEREVIDLSHIGLELAVLLDDGQWRIYWDDSSRLGPPIPTGYRMLALAGGERTLYAIARHVSPTPPPAPSTAPAGDPGATTAPATQPTPPAWALFVLDHSRWGSPIPLPPGVVLTTQTRFELAVVGDRVMLAWQDEDTVRVVAYTGDGWNDVAQFQRPQVAAFDILDAANGMLWMAPATGPGVLFSLDDPATPPIEMEHPADLSQPTPRAATTHATSIRLFFLKPDGLAVQTYTADGKRDSDLGTVPPPIPPADPRLSQWMQTLAMVAVLFVLFTTLRQRRQPQTTPEELKGIQLAPFGLRLAAGLIDLAPILLFVAWVSMQRDQQEWVATTRGQLLLYAASAVYLLHTAVTEAIFGRSIGKMFFGLKVVMIDGQPARIGPLVLRNVLRIIDLAFPFLPLLAVVFMPFRQRIGDIAAKTIVVEKTRNPQPPADEESKSDEDARE